MQIFWSCMLHFTAFRIWMHSLWIQKLFGQGLALAFNSHLIWSRWRNAHYLCSKFEWSWWIILHVLNGESSSLRIGFKVEGVSKLRTLWDDLSSERVRGVGGIILGIETSCNNTGAAMGMHAPLDHIFRIWFHSFIELGIIWTIFSLGILFISNLNPELEWLWWIILNESASLRIGFSV